MNRRAHACVHLALLAALAALATGCSSSAFDCPEGAVCDTSSPNGVLHGVSPDGTVDVTAEQAWPNRPSEPEPLTARQLAEACAIEGACALDPNTGAPFDDETVKFLVLLCMSPDGAEERVIPQAKTNERRSWTHRAALGAKGSCELVRALATIAPEERTCEEDGCWWSGGSTHVPSVSCAGDVATLRYAGRTVTRDCGHAYTRCDPSSASGCTDRAPVACDPKGSDKCDGDVRLGCDHAGRVSYHDCSRHHDGRCEDTASGPACVYAPRVATCAAAEMTCSGDVLTTCVDGTAATVDCKALGLAGCRAGRCFAP